MSEHTTPNHLGQKDVSSESFAAILPVAGWEISWHVTLERIEIRRRIDPPDEPEEWRPLTVHETHLMWDDCANSAYLPQVAIHAKPWRVPGGARDDLLHAAAHANPRDGAPRELSELGQAVYEMADEKPRGCYCLSVTAAVASVGGKNKYEGKHRLPMKEAKEAARGLRAGGFVKTRKVIGGRRREVWFKGGDGDPLISWNPRTGNAPSSFGGGTGE